MVKRTTTDFALLQCNPHKTLRWKQMTTDSVVVVGGGGGGDGGTGAEQPVRVEPAAGPDPTLAGTAQQGAAAAVGQGRGTQTRTGIADRLQSHAVRQQLRQVSAFLFWVVEYSISPLEWSNGTIIIFLFLSLSFIAPLEFVLHFFLFSCGQFPVHLSDSDKIIHVDGGNNQRPAN